MFGNLCSLRPSQTLLVTELLSCLTLEELKDVTQDVNKLDQEHVHFSSKTSIPVREHHLRYAMNKMNMLSGKTEYLPRLVNLQDDVGMLRQHFVPTHAFEHSVILRGTFLPLRTTYGSNRGVLLLWKKKDVSQMCVLDTHSLDLRHLKPNQWTCVFLWNSNGTMPVNPGIPNELMIPHPPGLPPPGDHPPANPRNDIPMDPDTDMHQPPLVPDEDQQDDNNDAPDDPMPPDDPPQHPHPDTHTHTHTPGPDPGSQPPDQPPSQPQFPLPGPYPPGPPFPGTTVPQPPHQPIPQPAYPPSLPLQPLPPDAFIPSLVVPPQVSDTQMQHSTKRESGQPASSPQKKAKAPGCGNQMPAPSGSSSRNHLGGDVPVSISSSSKPKDPKPDDNDDDDETDPQAGPSSGPPILPFDDNDEQQNQNEGNNDEKSDIGV